MSRGDPRLGIAQLPGGPVDAWALMLWLAQVDCNGLVGAELYKESPLVQSLSLSVQSIALLDMPVVW